MRKAVCALALFLLAANIGLLFPGCTPSPDGAATPRAPGARPDAATSLPRQAEWEKAVAVARQEGKIGIYTAMGVEMRTTLGEVFTKKYGVEIDLISGRSAELMAKMQAEWRAGLYLADAYVGGQIGVLQIQEAGFLQPIQSALLLPEVTETSKWLDGGPTFFGKDKSIIVFASHVNAPLVINKDLVNPPLTSVSQLLDPKWKGKILMGDPTITGAGNTFITGLGELHGEEFIRRLANQEPTVVRDYRTLAEWVARGKYPIATGPNPEQINAFIVAGAPIAIPTLTDLNFTSAGVGYIGLPNKQSHPNAAKVFLNWLLTNEGQTVFVKGVGTQSRRLDVTTEYTPSGMVRQRGVKYFNSELKEDFGQKMNYYGEKSREIFARFLN